MLATLLSYLQAHGIGTLLLVFTIASIVLSAVAQILQALGDQLPGWLGTIIDVVGRIVHFLNGNVAATISSAPTPVVPPPVQK